MKRECPRQAIPSNIFQIFFWIFSAVSLVDHEVQRLSRKIERKEKNFSAFFA